MTKDNNLLGKFELSGIPPAPRGVPQIEVTFDVDANGILNVSACDKSTNKTNKITITNDKGRLSKEEIDKMVGEAEKYAAEDDMQREKVAAKNGLESYVFGVKQALEEPALAGKIDAEDKRKVESKCDECLKWLDGNQLAEAEEFESTRKDLEAVVNPIYTKLHRQSGAGGPAEGSTGSCGAQSGGNYGGPTVEEVD